MKSSALGTILAALALGGVGLLYLRVGELSDQVKGLTRSPAPRTPAAGDATLRRAGPRVRGGLDAEPGSTERAGGVEGGRLAGRGAPEADSTPDASADGAARAPRGEDGQPRSAWYRYPGQRRFARSVDDLGTKLKLSANQKDRIADAVKRGKQRIEDILRIPDETGKSPFERRQERTRKLMEALKNRDGSEGHSVFAFATDMFAYRNKKIPGQNATYGQEIDRIKQETREEIRGTLDPKQAETFDETSIDPMLGGGGGAMAISVVQTVNESGEPGQTGADVVVESEGAITLTEPESGSGDEPKKD